MTEYEKLNLRLQVAILHQLALLPKASPVGAEAVEAIHKDFELRKGIYRDVQVAILNKSAEHPSIKGG